MQEQFPAHKCLYLCSVSIFLYLLCMTVLPFTIMHSSLGPVSGDSSSFTTAQSDSGSIKSLTCMSRGKWSTRWRSMELYWHTHTIHGQVSWQKYGKQTSTLQKSWTIWEMDGSKGKDSAGEHALASIPYSSAFSFLLNDLSEKNNTLLTYVIIIIDKHDCQPSTVQILETMTSY